MPVGQNPNFVGEKWDRWGIVLAQHEDRIEQMDQQFTYLPAEALAEMESANQRIPAAHAVVARDLRQRFMGLPRG